MQWSCSIANIKNLEYAVVCSCVCSLQLTCYSRRVGRRLARCEAGWARLGRNHPDPYRSDSRPGASVAPSPSTMALVPETPLRYLVRKCRKERDEINEVKQMLNMINFYWFIQSDANPVERFSEPTLKSSLTFFFFLKIKTNTFSLVFALTCVEEMSLRVTLRIVAFLRSKKEAHSTHLTRRHTTHVTIRTNHWVPCCSAPALHVATWRVAASGSCSYESSAALTKSSLSKANPTWSDWMLCPLPNLCGP